MASDNLRYVDALQSGFEQTEKPHLLFAAAVKLRTEA